MWYGIERSVLETFRSGWNWTFFGLATAQLVGLGAAAVAIVAIVIRHLWVRHRRRPDPSAEDSSGKPATGEEPAPATATAGDTEGATGSDAGQPAQA